MAFLQVSRDLRRVLFMVYGFQVVFRDVSGTLQMVSMGSIGFGGVLRNFKGISEDLKRIEWVLRGTPGCQKFSGVLWGLRGSISAGSSPDVSKRL